MTEHIGLAAIWDNSEFNKGQAEYMSKMLQSSSATGAISGSMNQLGMNTQGVGGLLSTLAGSLGISTTGMIALGGAIGIGIAAFKLITNAVGDFINYMVAGEDSAIKVAARLEELNLAAQAMGQQVGLSGTEVNNMVKQLTNMSVSATDANQVIADFARYGLNMTDVLKLATVAQNSSVLSGKSVTDTFTDMAGAIEMLRIRALKTNGIIFQASDAYQAYADTLGKDKDALTETEQQQAFLNTTIEKGTAIQGLYALGLQTAELQMSILNSTSLPNLKAALGAPFQGAFLNVAKALNSIVTTITALVSEGGALYPLMIELGAIFKVITEPLLGLGDALTNFVNGDLTNFATNIQTYVDNAIDWGTDLVTNFATGMINAASTALITAINYIGSVLTSWFSPGSPPKILPHIDVWGSEAMEEYLKGFTEADYSILSEVQKPIQEALGSLADMGAITKQAASALYVSLSEGMIKALAGGGLTDELLNQLTAAGGIYGDELADLAQKEFALAGAEKAVTDNEKALADAQKRAATAGAAVNQGLIEYNQMLRGGASKKELAAKLAQINASKQAQVTANKDIDAKQTALDLAKAQLIATQDQVQAIKDMLKVMIDLNKAQIVSVTPEAAAAGGKAAGGGGGEKPKAFDPSEISNAISDAVDNAAKLLQAKVWVSIKWIERVIGESWRNAIFQVQLAWNNFFGSLPAWLQTALTDMWANSQIIWGDISNVWSDMVAGNWSKALDDIMQLALDWWVGFQQLWHDWLGGLGDWFSTQWNNMGATITNWAMNALSDIAGWIADVDGQLIGWENDEAGKWNTFWDTAKQKVSDTWDGIVTGIGEKVGAAKDAIVAFFEDPDTGIFAKFTGWIADMVTKGGELIGGLVTGVTNAAQGLIDTVVGAVSDAIDAAKDFLHIPHSPSGLQLMGIYGKEIMKSLSLGIEANVNLPQRAIQGAMVQTLAPAAAVPVTMGATNNYYQPNFNMPTTINSGIGMAQYQALIMRTVKKGIGK